MTLPNCEPIIFKKFSSQTVKRPASYRELGGEELLPEDVRAPFASLADWTDPNAEFQGKKITAALAPDILCDIASRLTALGAIE